MHASRKLKKRSLWVISIPILFLLTAGGILYFFIVYRFKDGIKYILNKESNGKFAFDASDAEISLWHGSIRLKNAVLYTPDSAEANAYFTARIPGINFTITSWRDLILHKKIMIDSLSIIQPAIDINVRNLSSHPQQHPFHASDVLPMLEKALTRFNVHSFSLQDAAFSYRQPGAIHPFEGDHITLAVSNFASMSNDEDHPLGADNVVLSMGPQHWSLPDNRHFVVFRRLGFDGKAQRFVLDSLSFVQLPANGPGVIRLQAERIFFNARHLPATYQKGQLLLDTLVCVNPILSIPGLKQNKTQIDSAHIRMTNDLFNYMNIRYVSVVNGELLLQNKEGRTGSATARKANLEIYNLSVHPEAEQPLSNDSIRLSLRNTEFWTTDSLYRLTIDNFLFRRNDATFGTVRFGPTRPAVADKRVEFTAPALVLKDISLVELLQSRLKASGAELLHPSIIMIDRRKEQSHQTIQKTTLNAAAAAADRARKLALFYRALHHIRDLINAPDFYITNGSASYQLLGSDSLHAMVSDLNAHILLNRFFYSDSLVDIKRAIPQLRIGKMNLKTKGANIDAASFEFNGAKGFTLSRQFALTTRNGLSLKGDNISWNRLDWDDYQRRHYVVIDSLHADRLIIKAGNRPAPAHSPGTTPNSPAQQSVSAAGNADPNNKSGDPGFMLPIGSQPPIPLPGIHVGTLLADNIIVDGNQLHFELNAFEAKDIASINQHFTWKHLTTGLHNVHIQKPGSDLSIQEAAIGPETYIKNLQYSNPARRIQVSIPLIKLQTRIYSTDFSRLDFDALDATGGSFSYTHVSPEGDSIDLNLPFSLHLGSSQIDLSGKPRVGISAAIRMDWQNANLYLHKGEKMVSVRNLAGSFNDDRFFWSSGVKLGWQQLVASTMITKGSIDYKDNNISAGAGRCAWSPQGHRLELNAFRVSPNETRDQALLHAQWQKDYITVRGSRLTLSHIRFPEESDPFSIRVPQVTLDSVVINVSRDKNIPFRHGFEKSMPTKLIQQIPMPVNIDSLFVQDSRVIYNERSITTGRWSQIPIENLNGSLVHLGNTDYKRDTLTMNVSANLFGNHIRRFVYRESYGDSLSGFMAYANFSPHDLKQFSQFSIPAAAVSIIRGNVDTVWSSWQGNKYACFGEMNFYYDRLKIKVLNKNDSLRRGFLPTVETWAANLILPNHRQRSSLIYFERNREKFVFNYWIKAQESGILSTVGVKSNAGYRRAWQRKYKQYHLPPHPKSARRER